MYLRRNRSGQGDYEYWTLVRSVRRAQGGLQPCLKLEILAGSRNRHLQPVVTHQSPLPEHQAHQFQQFEPLGDLVLVVLESGRRRRVTRLAISTGRSGSSASWRSQMISRIHQVR
jgi:hypothetical protein